HLLILFLSLLLFIIPLLILYFLFFFFTDPATSEIYTLSLHDALPISGCRIRGLSVWEFDFSFFCLVTKPLLVVRRRRGQTLPVYFPALHGNAPASAIDAM